MQNLSFEEHLELFNIMETHVEIKPEDKEISSIRFNKRSLQKILAEIMGIDLESWINLMDTRGMKPIKAALRLGAKESIAQLVGDLQLAISVEEINKAYADDRCKSCMTGAPVGEFYHRNNVGVIYAPNFRLLVGRETLGLNPKGYGFKGAKVREILKGFFDEEQVPLKSIYKWKIRNMFVGRAKPIMKVSFKVLTITTVKTTVMIPNKARLLALHALEENDRNLRTTFAPSEITTHTLGNCEYSLTVSSYSDPMDTDSEHYNGPLPEEYRISREEGLHIVMSDAPYTQLLKVVHTPVRYAMFEDREVVIRDIIIDSPDDGIPFLDFGGEVIQGDKAEALKLKHSLVFEPEQEDGLDLLDPDNMLPPNTDFDIVL